MRIFTLLAARGTPKETTIPFKEILPLKLKATVSGKGDKTSEVCCIQEMSVMLACFKTNEFDQSLCSKEINNFQECYTTYLTVKKLKKERDEKGILTPGEKRLTHKQINKILKKFPDIK